MATLKHRLQELETRQTGAGAKELPILVPDSTSDAELAKLRKHGREVFRKGDPAFIDSFIIP